MQTLILCGGMGTRAYPYTRQMPKALMPVNGYPILAHVMQIYCFYGHTDFVLSLGHLKEPIIEYFSSPKFAHLNIEFVDTGETTDTGGRVKGCEHLLEDQLPEDRHPACLISSSCQPGKPTHPPFELCICRSPKSD